MTFNLPRYLQRGVVITLAVALALAVGYWNIRPASFTGPALVQDPLQPDFFMVNPHIVMLGADGQPTYELTSERATHLVSDDSTRLDMPHLLFFREDEPQPWSLTATYGRVTEGGDRVQLNENVLLEQEVAGEIPRRMTTTALTVFPPRDYAETDQSVRIEAARNVTTATGMQVHFNDGRLLLLSNVRGQHEVR